MGHPLGVPPADRTRVPNVGDERANSVATSPTPFVLGQANEIEEGTETVNRRRR
jgi:hypothetical protein